MKCDELKDKWFWAYPTESVDCDGITGSAHEVYSKSEVDAAIAELKAENERLTIDERNAELRADVADAAVEKLKAENVELKQKLQDQCISCPVKMQEDDVIAEKENEIRRLKRALWLARSYRGRDNSILLPSKFMRNVWDKVERKCLKKAEQYK